MSKNTSHSTALQLGRHRAWSITSVTLTREIIEEFVAVHPNDRAHGAIHDRDPGTETHGHIFFCSNTQRTAAAIQRKFPVSVIVEPFIVHPGEPGTDRGKFAMARGARYNTHEHPDQQALGKARYGDEEMIATPGWNWRAEVDALNARERVDPARPARLTVIEGISKRLLKGELSARDVHQQYEKIFLAKGLSYWAGLERTAAEWKRQEVLETERRAYEERRHAADAEQAERARLAGDQDERERQAAIEREAAERAEHEALARRVAEERAAREAALKAEQAKPEYQARVATEEANRECDDLIDMIAMWFDVKGSRRARSSQATRYAAELGLTFSEHVRDDGKLTHLGAVLAYAEAVMGIEPDDVSIDEIMPEIREEIVSHRRDIASMGRQLAGSELHAADGDQQSFEKALHLRQTYSGYPDLITLPSLRSDIKKAWHDQLSAAS